MQAPVFGLDGRQQRILELPPVFNTPFRPDVIQRVYTLVNSHSYQQQGRDPEAGERTSAETYNPPTGHGIARLPRIKGERHPKAGWAGGVASIVGGRLAHPPRAEKRIWKRVNAKERRFAIASSIAATAVRQLVQRRGHRLNGIEQVPIIVENELETVIKARELRDVLRRLRLHEELARLERRWNRRSGKPRMRGRVTRKARGPLVIVAEDRGIARAVRGFPGMECIRAKNLSVEVLAPGAQPGRLTIWTERALAGLSTPVAAIGIQYAS